MIEFTYLTFLAAWKFYIGFAACICAYRQYLKGSLNALNVVLFSPALVSFYFTDLVLNWTLLTLMFGRTPDGTKSISDRFKYYREVAAPSEFAKQFATFTCEKLLNPVDPSETHC